MKKEENGKKLEEKGRNGETEEKTRPKVKITIFGENLVFGENFLLLLMKT